MTEKQRLTFELENISNTKTASAWRMRENFIAMYECQTSEQAMEYFNAWYKSATHSSNKHIKKAAKTIKEHIGNIASQIGSTISNSRAEQANSKIAKIQSVAQCYHNFDNLRAASLFFNGNLSLFQTIND
jgi:transposase